MCGYILIGVFFLTLIVGVWIYSQKPLESFKVLGTLAPYAPVYYKCVSECERSDPGKRLMPTKGSFACQEYCDSVLTDIARRGGPSYPDEYPIVLEHVSTAADDANSVCGEGTKGAWCRQIYFTDREIDEKCRQDCEYSTQPSLTCMNLCAKARSANKSIGWSRK